MVIDIVTLTDEQYALMGEGQLLEVRNAQARVNRLRKKLAEMIDDVKFRMIKNGVGRSASREAFVERETARVNEEIEQIRKDLLFYLRFVMKPVEEGGAPYILDYSLKYEERVPIVRDYYLETYSDASERFAAFQKDDHARGYLGEYYVSLSAYLEYLSEQGN